jgi:plasmid stabilization system protein ParE
VFVEKIVEAAGRLVRFPYMGRRVVAVDGFRELVFHNYRIIYEPREDGVWIMAVMHDALDFRKLATKRRWNLS